MSVGFIMYEIVDKDSLKNQGINTTQYNVVRDIVLDIHLNIKALTPLLIERKYNLELDIHLNF